MARILIPTDFSENSLHAAAYAVELFGRAGNQYVLLHTFMDASVDPYLSASFTNELMKASEDGLRLFSDRFVGRTGAEGVEQRVLYGTLAPVVSDLFKDGSVDLVVMGKRGQARAMFFGSNVVDVIKHGHASVLIVPEDAPNTEMKHILLADDHEEIFPSDLSLLRRIALMKKAEVLVAHMEMELAEGHDHWSNALYEIALEGVPHTFTTAHGREAVHGLEHMAHRRRMDMIVILHRHLGLLEGLFHRSAAKELALETDIPLLVLQHDGR